MNIENSVRLALREFADPQCQRCSGAGLRGELKPDSVCRCVAERAPHDAAAASGPDALPHPWGAVTRRAQKIHAAAVVDRAPDDWSS